MNTTLNSGHFIGVDKEVLVLPVTTCDEEHQGTTQESMFNFIRLSDGGNTRIENARSEIDIITYYQEFNILVPPTTDLRSLTPANKMVNVKILTTFIISNQNPQE